MLLVSVLLTTYCHAKETFTLSYDVIDRYMKMKAEKIGFSGAVMIAVDGNPVYKKTFCLSTLGGWANSLDTQFRIASLSKQFTATAILYLDNQNKLNASDVVCQYLKAFCEHHLKTITLHHLLSHTSGLSRISTGFLGTLKWYYFSKKATPLKKYVDLAARSELLCEPGKGYE